MKLDACAVHLPFERHFAAELSQGFARISCGLGQHWSNWNQDFELKPVEAVNALEQRYARHYTEARIHRGTSHLRCGQIRRRSNGI